MEEKAMQEINEALGKEIKISISKYSDTLYLQVSSTTIKVDVNPNGGGGMKVAVVKEGQQVASGIF